MASIPTVDSGVGLEQQPHMPSEVVSPTRVDEAPQQASTAPGDGRVVHDNHNPPADSDMTDENKVPFKEKMIGYAQKTRGTILRKPSLKEHGEKILQGETTHADDRQK
ncbi:hypothetical protein JOM56_010356 [Amanita muscaria]